MSSNTRSSSRFSSALAITAILSTLGISCAQEVSHTPPKLILQITVINCVVTCQLAITTGSGMVAFATCGKMVSCIEMHTTRTQILKLSSVTRRSQRAHTRLRTAWSAICGLIARPGLRLTMSRTQTIAC